MIKPGFTGSPLDRADRLRNDAEAFNAALNDWRARVLGLDGLDPVVASEGGLKWVSMAEVDVSVELILLGLANGKPHFVPLVEACGRGMARSPAVWRALSMLPAEDAAIYGTARSLIDWHNAHKYCGRCGGFDQGLPRRLGAAMHRLRRRTFPAHRPCRHHDCRI
jgi:NAD+ diphosphatase